MITMPKVAGISDNHFQTRHDVERACLALLDSLCKYQSPGGARIKIPVATGAHFDERAAQLEGFARPLWAVASLLIGHRDNDNVTQLGVSFARGLANGTDPKHEEYWGPVTTSDQRMVEMEIIAFALLGQSDVFYHGQSPEAQTNIKQWLMSINGKPMPPTNWRWFRVFTNLALSNVCGVSDLQSAIEEDMQLLESFYIAGGWSGDGLWSDAGRQADYYSGSFAIQFSQLMYVKFAETIDPLRCKRFRERAFEYSKDFVHYFNQNGAAIPFGRSLTYRFAAAAFWGAAAFAEVELSSPVENVGTIKHLLLQHMRWWSAKDDMFNSDGTLTIGFTYPNMFLCEDYNSPQSVYWCMKTFCCLGLTESHPFWQAAEKPVEMKELHHTVRPAMQITCDTGHHHFLLSSGQFCPWPLKATEAKYSKFAYSSHFGFSVPTGPLLQQMAPDSTLALRIQGDDVWKVRWIPLQPRFSSATLIRGTTREVLPVLVSSWRPWNLLDVIIQTALIPPSSRWKDWHIRIHRILKGKTPILIDAVEGGFATFGRKLSDGLPLIEVVADETITVESIATTSDGCLISSSTGVSGIRSLRSDSESTLNPPRGYLLKPDSNTNLMCNRTVIPCLEGMIDLTNNQEQILVTGVFARETYTADAVECWKHAPRMLLGGSPESSEEPYVSFNDW